jgi:CheY-like chemotaxis protein
MSKILVIEDDAEFNKVLCEALMKKGYSVLSAPDGKKGIDLYRKTLADLVITDILMPEQDGIEVILNIKKISPNVKIIAISGGGQFGTSQEYLQSAQVVCGVQYTLSKPFERNQLFRMIQKILK